MTYILASVLSGCLINDALYEERLADLRDGDSDGWSRDDGDCDDADPAVHPGAEDGCDGEDADCDGAVDEDASASTWFADVDEDGYGDPGSTSSACAAPAGHVSNSDDCDDENSAASPGGVESWSDDGVDNDCDGEAFEPVTWEAGDAVTRVDGAEPGGELGRRLVAAPELGCLFATAPYVEEARGAVYAIDDAGPGVRQVGDPLATGPGPSSFLTAAALTARGELALTALPAEGGRGAVWLVDAAAACAGPVGIESATPIVGAAPDDLFGATVRALPDLDGDGLGELAVFAPGYDGTSGDEGAMALFFEPGGASFADADVVVTGGYEGAGLADVVFAASADADGWLLFARSTAAETGIPLVRVPVDALATGSLEDLADGGLATTETWAQPTIVGDLDFDGADEVVVGSSAWRLWSVTAFEGVVEDGDGGSPLVAGEDDEWLTGFAPLGDVDGGGRPDLLLLADDWPAGASRGRLGMLLGEDFLPGQPNALAAQRRVAAGDAPGDTFGYRAEPVGDLDGDTIPDVAVSAYGTDMTGSNAGSVYLLPLPNSR